MTGAAIGLQAALSSILTTWLSDLKLGYCSQGWYLNRKFCCWEIEEDMCEDWKTWTSFSAIQWGVYVGFAVSLFPLSSLRYVAQLIDYDSVHMARHYSPSRALSSSNRSRHTPPVPASQKLNVSSRAFSFEASSHSRRWQSKH